MNEIRIWRNYREGKVGVQRFGNVRLFAPDEAREYAHWIEHNYPPTEPVESAVETIRDFAGELDQLE